MNNLPPHTLDSHCLIIEQWEQKSRWNQHCMMLCHHFQLCILAAALLCCATLGIFPVSMLFTIADAMTSLPDLQPEVMSWHHIRLVCSLYPQAHQGFLKHSRKKKKVQLSWGQVLWGPWQNVQWYHTWDTHKLCIHICSPELCLECLDPYLKKCAWIWYPERGRLFLKQEINTIYHKE